MAETVGINHIGFTLPCSSLKRRIQYTDCVSRILRTQGSITQQKVVCISHHKQLSPHLSESIYPPNPLHLLNEKRDWLIVGKSALQGMDFDVGRKAFIRLRDTRLVDILSEVEMRYLQEAAASKNSESR